VSERIQNEEDRRNEARAEGVKVREVTEERKHKRGEGGRVERNTRAKGTNTERRGEKRAYLGSTDGSKFGGKRGARSQRDTFRSASSPS